MTRVNRALAHFRLVTDEALTADEGGRIPTFSAEYHAHDTLLRLVAIAEDYSLIRFVDSVEARLPKDPIVEALWDAELDNSADSWPRRRELWKTYLGVSFSRFSDDNSLDGFIVARNAIAHGLGQLTRKQLGKRQRYVTKLGHAKIALRGDLLIIGVPEVERCAGVVTAFVDWLDALA